MIFHQLQKKSANQGYSWHSEASSRTHCMEFDQKKWFPVERMSTHPLPTEWTHVRFICKPQLEVRGVFRARKAHVKRTHEPWRDSLSMTLMHLRGRSGAYCQLYRYQYLSPNFNMSIYVKADLKPFHSRSKCLVCEHIWQLISQYRGLHPFVPLHAERPATLWEVQKGCWTSGSWKGVALWIVTFYVFIILSFWLTVVSAISGNPPMDWDVVENFLSWLQNTWPAWQGKPCVAFYVERPHPDGLQKGALGWHLYTVLKTCTWHVIKLINIYIYIIVYINI